MSGELRGGPFRRRLRRRAVRHPDAVEALRATRREPKRGEIIRLSACDPLNLVGVITPGGRIPAALPNAVIYEDGVPQAVGTPAPASGPARGWAPPAIPDVTPVTSRSGASCR
jgi:hypothetical protein